jgi:ABC-type nitrate/sulfonate/bicarbonate transport system permease component
MKGRRSPLVALYLRHERLVLGLAVAVLVLVAWEGLSRGWWADLLRPVLGAGAERLRIRPIFISSPSAVAAAAWRLYFVTGEIWPHLAMSGLEIAAGLSASIVFGIPFGLAAGRYRTLSYAVEPFMTALNATPQVAFLPLIVLWMGTGLVTRIFVVFLLTLMPIFISAYAAVRSIDAKLLKVAASFGASEAFLFRSIVLPGVVPFLLAGLRLAIGRAMIGVIVGELVGPAIGVGLMINRAGSMFQTDTVFVGVITIVVAGLALTEAVRSIERKVEIWRPDARQQAS